MQESGQSASSAGTGTRRAGLRQRGAFFWALFALGAAAALVPSLYMWGFTVDDALIAVRYAHHLAIGSGYRFNLSGPSTDGVTPLPWPFLLAPLAHGDAMTTLVRAKVVGVGAWTLGGALLGAEVGKAIERREAPRWRFASLGAGALVVVGLAFEIGAWAASGMETGLVLALATVASIRVRKPFEAALAAGLAATLRPELVVWACVLASGAAMSSASSSATMDGSTEADLPRIETVAIETPGATLRRDQQLGTRWLARALLAAAIAGLPFASCALVRMVVFGRAVPLAVMAKPSDLSHGIVYVVAAALVLLTPVLVTAPVALKRTPGRARALALAFVCHALAVVAAGGDWMPYGRLMVVVAPSLVVAFVDLWSHASAVSAFVRVALASAFGVFMLVRAAPAGRHVQADRAALVAQAAPLLGDARVVAALDVGWVGAATGADIVDLAGLTDPLIASLPGGHTSKRVDVAMLLDRDVDVVVVYSDMRVVEARIVHSELFASRFEPRATLLLGSSGVYYTLYARRATPGAGAPRP